MFFVISKEVGLKAHDYLFALALTISSKLYFNLYFILQLYLKFQWNSRTFLAYRTEPNRIKHEFAGSELFQYFDVFSSSVRSNWTLFYCIWIILHDVFDTFEWFLWVRFDRVELEITSKYWKSSIRFGSIFQESSRQFHKALFWVNILKN